jgi:nucleoside phosphorylase
LITGLITTTGEIPSKVDLEKMTTPTIHIHDDYTVGLICALPLELAAATAMLDEIHDDLPTPPLDNNIYTLGKMGTHKVVISCCPPGVYGTTSAAIVALQMMSAFQSIRFGLMVGIGGGVPSKQADIRLGDIVVSIPTAHHGGVIQYDYGKLVGEGDLQYAGTLNKPPRVLCTAVAELRMNHSSSNKQIPTYLSAMVNRYPRMSSFTHQGQNQDYLFEAHYDHISSNSTCDKCDKSRIVSRPIRNTEEPEIHYGLIGSGNTVMKHGPTRDRLAHELGILCFEMEAAGLMDHFPCLVVRGICDYADSHKNKEWQKYAAATAAAYAKELLSVIPSHVISDMLAASKLPRPNDDENFKVLSHDDYTVGLVCTCPQGFTAATAMLDEIHDDLPTPSLDRNLYTLGKMGMHNVVISCHPPELYGLISAGAVAAQMVLTFQSLRFGLMVGIGSGVPSKQADIRLGDIVVSIPTAHHGGVGQYDQGRVVKGQSASSVLNKPPQVLLKAVAKLQAEIMLNGSQISTYISKIAIKHSIGSSFTYQGQHQDHLFEAHYDHISSSNTCDECDKSRLVSRPIRDTEEPEIHYGLVGSSNTVIWRGSTRDMLAYKSEILCFEMDAASVMDDFPCLVIRGICDYADSHKNQEWQKYAAATAAAYARQILAVVP